MPQLLDLHGDLHVTLAPRLPLARAVGSLHAGSRPPAARHSAITQGSLHATAADPGIPVTSGEFLHVRSMNFGHILDNSCVAKPVAMNGSISAGAACFHGEIVATPVVDVLLSGGPRPVRHTR
jgi:hypothetical protein